MKVQYIVKNGVSAKIYYRKSEILITNRIFSQKSKLIKQKYLNQFWNFWTFSIIFSIISKWSIKYYKNLALDLERNAEIGYRYWEIYWIFYKICVMDFNGNLLLSAKFTKNDEKYMENCLFICKIEKPQKSNFL